MCKICDALQNASCTRATYHGSVVSIISNHVVNAVSDQFSKSLGQIDVYDCIGAASDLPYGDFVRCRTILGSDVRNCGVCGHGSSVPNLLCICRDIMRNIPFPLVGCISFKAGGVDYIDKINICNIEGEEIRQTVHTVMVLGERIIDFVGGYSECTPVQYLDKLYTWNSSIRIDYSISDFYPHRLDSFFTDEMYSTMRSREGLTKEMFLSLTL